MQKVKTYPSGMQLVVETMPNYESVSFNMFVNTGSMNEDDKNRGISHLIEHMNFKGTKKRSALDIVIRLDAIGAAVNAYTSKTETVYYTKSTAEGLNECVDILSDMYFNSVFDKKELAREKKVVVEEISMYNDNPQAVADELASSVFYKGTAMEHDVAGSKTSVRNITREQILDYKNRFYLPSNLILSFAGNVTFEEAENLAQNFFEANFKSKSKPILVKTPEVLTVPQTKYVKKFKDNEQAQIVISYPSLNIHDKDYYELTIFNVIWGRGMSSRLFQTIREKLGLVYSIFSEVEQSNLGGSINIYLGTTFKNSTLAVKTLGNSIREIAENGVTAEELRDAKTQVINTFKLNYEDTARTSLFNAKHLAVYGTLITKEEVIKKIEELTLARTNAVANKIYSSQNFVIASVGKDMKTDLLKVFKNN
ncbi:MAG: M16 family metallopeptidase [Spirochaetales bacterium]